MPDGDNNFVGRHRFAPRRLEFTAVIGTLNRHYVGFVQSGTKRASGIPTRRRQTSPMVRECPRRRREVDSLTAVSCLMNWKSSIALPVIPSSPILRMDRLGAYGHSFGGAVGVELARERLPRASGPGIGWDAARSRICSWSGQASDHVRLALDDYPGDHSGNPRLAETSSMWNIIAESKIKLLERCGGVRIIIDGLAHHDFTDQILMSRLRRLSSTGVVPPKPIAHVLTTFVLAFSSRLCLLNRVRFFRRVQRTFPR
jgi:hypothetical protein